MSLVKAVGAVIVAGAVFWVVDCVGVTEHSVRGVVVESTAVSESDDQAGVTVTVDIGETEITHACAVWVENGDKVWVELTLGRVSGHPYVMEARKMSGFERFNDSVDQIGDALERRKHSSQP